MKLSAKTRYAVRIMIDIAQQEGQRVPLRHTADRQGVKSKYCEAVIPDLRRAGLVKSFRGMRGGYLLARPAKKISLGDIVRAVDDLYAASGDPEDVGIEKTFELVQAAMWRKLDAVSLADAAK